ncbi:poly [ADP-ribose] polymerase tankyrase-like [Saccostrea echinata]|uniref:poly [ADP-ribose] polymerase tankyrase-like n=1 Tax=Saccostrea echinata TaxID=191078 RepID=UPI002A83D50A|nr:poly [ADP-ribose] polymerase tankyrase-like [Saccostrea echinata]
MATPSTLHKLPLHSAAKENDIVKLEQFFLDGDSHTVNLQDQHGRTALHCLLDSPTFSDLEEVKRGIQILLDNGADINIQNEHGETPLHTVVKNYLEFIPEIIRYILTHSKNYVMDKQDENGYSLFHLFMSDFSDLVIKSNGYKKLSQEKNEFLQSLLRGEILQYNFSALLNQKERNGYSAFHTYNGNSDCSPEIIQLMVRCGGDVNTASKLGITPLMESVLRGRRDIVGILLKAGANPNQTDIFGQSCIFRVYTNDCFELLNQFGADFHIKDKFGRIPITNNALYTPEDLPHSGIVISNEFSHYPPLIEKFLDVGININELDKHGSSALHYGAWYGDPTMVRSLLQHGADLNILDHYSYSPLDLAMHVGNDNLYIFLGNTDDGEIRPECETRYCRLLINEAETDNMKTVLNDYLGIRDDPIYLVTSLAKSPRLGMTDKRPESRLIKSEVTDLMERIADVVGKLNPLFSCKIYPTGSSSEGTKVGDPDEFDFVFCLENFSKHCVPHQDDVLLNSGFVSLKIESSESVKKFDLFLDGKILSAEGVRDTFQDLVTSALNTASTWTSEYLYFDGLLGFPMDKPVLKLEIHWFGPLMKHMIVGVDIVPAVLSKDWRPVELSEKQPLFSVEEQYMFILNSPESYQWNDKDSEHLVRISSCLMDKHYLKSLPQICTESYAAAKILKSSNFSPNVQFDDDFTSTDSSSFGDFEESSQNSDGKQDINPMNRNGRRNKYKREYSGYNSQNVHAFVKSLPFEDPVEVSTSNGRSDDITDRDDTQRSKCNFTMNWLMDIDDTCKVRKIFTPRDENELLIDEGFCKTSPSEKNKD